MVILGNTWKYNTDDDGNLCLYYKNPDTKNWDLYKIIKKPRYKKGKISDSKKCVIQ